MKQFNIEDFLSLFGYEVLRKNRRKGSAARCNKESKNTQEFFTPYSIVKKMADKVSESDWADPDKTLLNY